MSKYQLVSNAFLNGDVQAAGSVVELDDETAAGYLERGTIVAYTGNDSTGEDAPAPAPLDLPASPSAPVAEPQTETPAPSTETQPTSEQLQQDFEETGAVDSNTPEAPSSQPPVQLG